MTRVLQCVVGMNRGGLETFTMNLLRNIDRELIQFDFLVSLDGDYDEEIRELGGQIFKIPFINKVGPFAYAANLRSFFKNHREYKIIHIQMDKFGGMIAREACKTDIPVRIVHSHNTQNEGGITQRLVKNYYGRMVLNYATHLFACGYAAADWMFGKDAKKAVIVNNGIDLERFKVNDTREAEFLTIGNIARFAANKNHDFLLDILYEVKKKDIKAKLLLAGDGALLEDIKRKANQLNLTEDIEFMGVRSDVENVYTRCDVICMPSLHEGLPVTLVEAQACGVPCLVSDTISRECDITGEVDFLSLNDPPSVWAEKLLEYKGYPRKNNTEILEEKGYSIKQTALEMQEFYVKLG